MNFSWHADGPAVTRRRALRSGALAVASGAALLSQVGCKTSPPAARTAAEAPPAAAEPEPSSEGWQLAAEFDPQAAVWLGHGPGHEDLTAGLVAALQPHVALKFLVRDPAAEHEVRAFLRQRQLGERGVSFVQEALATFFVRDVAVFTRGPEASGPGAAAARRTRQSSIGVLDLRWTEYGMPAWCARRWAGNVAAERGCEASADYSREVLDLHIARHAGARLHRSNVAMEGGGIEANGRGVLIANAALYATRNPGKSQADLDAELHRLPGIRRVIWLPEGLAEDPHLRASINATHVAWGTGGHTDEFVRFADAQTVLLAWPEDTDVASNPVSRLTRQRMQRNFEILSRATDAQGRPLRVLKVPMPRPVQRRVFLSAGAETAWSREWSAEYFASREGRWQGQPLMQLATCSYLNHVVANGVVVLPDYVRHGTPSAVQERVRRLYETAFAGRQIRFVDAISANWVGGGMHCATLNEPA